ncbi:MAG: 2-hydroxyacyl-CoA dehydratase [Clostridiales bacterium]|nr:2-hydroxyacyl-CoA dehydratase [Clostridiales bacterium]
MAKLIYDKNGRLLFTKEMKKEYTLLIPQMLPIHFGMMRMCLQKRGYNCVTMDNMDQRAIADIGLKYVHNDTCYPALLVIGQLIEAVGSGKYDKDKVGLFITQTGGGCRASNYIHLLRKALKKADMEQVPVISINLSGLEKNPGFKLTLPLILELVFSIVYGDIIMLLANQCRPYEVNKGDTDALVHKWEERLVDEFSRGGFGMKKLKKNFDLIVADFARIERVVTPRPRVGVVGEIYVKYSPLGNNNLEQFLQDEGAEVVVPGLVDFVIFKIYNRDADVDLYGGSKLKKLVVGALQKYVEKCQQAMIDAVKKCPEFRPPSPFSHLKEKAAGYLGKGNKMGEGWLLTAEMLELIEDGTNNIVCTQPFGCLPNHIVGKGMIRRLKDDYPKSNIVAIDYDPGATKINQENRIKLMLANAGRMEKAEERETVEV